MIRTLEVRNFRNIPNGKYDLTHKCVIAGKNFTGKTNLLNAIYWALTDKLLGDNSDAQSLKPTHDKKSEVFVKITFDGGHFIEKTYKEKWVTTRGTGIERLEGHETKVILDDLVIPQSKVLAKIKRDFLGINYFTDSKIDVVQALIDPLYLWENTKMKDRRQFLVELVGDVSLEQVYAVPEIATNKHLAEVEEKIKFHNGSIELAMKLYNQQVKRTNDDLEIVNIQLEAERNKVDVDPDKLAVAQKREKEINELISARRQSKMTAVNPMVAKIQEEISKVQDELSAINNSDRERWQKATANIEYENRAVNEEIKSLNSEKDSMLAILNETKTNLLIQKSKIESCKKSIEDNEKIATQTRSEYLGEQATEFIPVELPESVNCPHCGGVLNESIIESVMMQNVHNKLNFNKLKEERLARIREKGHAAKNEVERLKLEIEELTKSNISLQKDIDIETAKMNEIEARISLVKEGLKVAPRFEQSQEYNNKIVELENLRVKLAEEKRVDFTLDIDKEIASLKEELSSISPILSAHAYYVQTQDYIQKLEADFTSKKSAKAEAESKLMLCELILSTKLEMLKKQVETVFGTIEIRLVESNIKEGSWNEVCYPLITDEKTGSKVPFENASRSQKYIYGIRLLECLRQATMTGNDTPILIDEIGTFDSETIAVRLNTKAQIIATRCDDYFDKPTIINL